MSAKHVKAPEGTIPLRTTESTTARQRRNPRRGNSSKSTADKFSLRRNYSDSAIPWPSSKLNLPISLSSTSTPLRNSPNSRRGPQSSCHLNAHKRKAWPNKYILRKLAESLGGRHCILYGLITPCS